MKTTPLHSVYAGRDGTKLGNFGGWEMPIQFSDGILAEYKTVREKAGLFDVAHMGEISVQGRDAQSFLEYLLTNRIIGVSPGHCLYTPMCRDGGGTVDDLLVYVMEASKYLLVVNASNIEKDFQWMLGVQKSGGWDVEISDRSAEWALLALQGPFCQSILSQLTLDFNPNDLIYYRHERNCHINDIPVLISRTGYTGEDGFELYCQAALAPALWQILEEAGARPCGLGARDMLRLEATLPLYGHELTDSISPLEAGLHSFVKLDKDDFIGKSVLQAQKTEGLSRRIYGLEMIDSGVAREGYEVFMERREEPAGDALLGTITSGGKSPLRGSFIALAILENIGLKIGDVVDVDIRGKHKRACIVKKPFYKRTG